MYVLPFALSLGLERKSLRAGGPRKRRLGRAAFPRASPCSRNCSRPTLRFRFRAGNSGVNAHPSRSAIGNILPNMAVPLRVAGRRNKFRPRSRRHRGSPALRSYYKCTHRRQWNPLRVCRYRSNPEAAWLCSISILLSLNSARFKDNIDCRRQQRSLSIDANGNASAFQSS